MSDEPMPGPRRRRWWWLLLLVPALPAAVVVAMWYLRPADEPGTRTRIVWPGSGGSTVLAGGGVQFELTPALREANIQARLGGRQRSADQILFICNEECKQEVVITAGQQPLRIAELRYTLFDAKGEEIGSGGLSPNSTLKANGEGQFTIGDFGLERASKIVLDKADK
jgi:hypothetical protein